MSLSSAKKREINSAIENTQVFVDSMFRWFRAGFYSHSIRDDSNGSLAMSRERKRIDRLMEQQSILSSVKNSNPNEQDINVNLNEVYQRIQKEAITVLENEISCFQARINKLKLEEGIKDPDGLVLTGFVDSDEADDLAIDLWEIQSRLKRYNEKLSLLRQSKKPNIKSISNMLNDISRCTAEYDMCLLKLGRETLSVDNNNVNWFNLSPREVVQQIFSINYQNFDSLIENSNFKLMLEANGEEYLKEMKRYMDKTDLKFNGIAKDRFNTINQSYMQLRNTLTNNGTMRIRDIMNNLDEGNSNDAAVTSIKVLVNVLDHKYNHKLKFLNKDNAGVKKDFLFEVAQLVKKYDDVLNSKDKAAIWEKVSKSKVAGYHRAGMNANNTYFGLSGSKTEAMKFCESLSKGSTEASYRGTTLTEMQTDNIQENDVEKYFTMNNM